MINVYVDDLGEDLQDNLLPTGYDLVKYICEKGLRANKIYLHTDNPVGREKMYQTPHERNEEVSLTQILKSTTILLPKINIPNEVILNNSNKLFSKKKKKNGQSTTYYECPYLLGEMCNEDARSFH